MAVPDTLAADYSLNEVSLRERLLAHLAIARLDHSIKNLFILPGIIVPLSVAPALLTSHLLLRIPLALIAATIIACSNYVLNETLDAPFDRLHPTKFRRPAARGLVHPASAYAQWILMMMAGILLAALISRAFALTALALWIMGCVYNVPPLRTKDVPYLDVITESVNNPLRMLLGWFAITSVLVPPVSLLIAYWMLGCYFMALKRFSELAEIGDSRIAGAYRRSFLYYTTESLLVSVLFYASAAMLFLGAFIIRYRIELILSFPFLALSMAIFMRLAFKRGSAVQNPEKLYREPWLMSAFLLTTTLMCVLLFVRIPFLDSFFLPTLPVSHAPLHRTGGDATSSR
jgi:decaprenyl-phosphate phosphoribosyltransferase